MLPGHLLGTDALGRDMLSRTAYGARATCRSRSSRTSPRSAWERSSGLLAGFHRGWIEHVLMRITDIFLAVPTVITGLALAGMLGTGMSGIVVVVTALYWAWTARLVFGETLPCAGGRSSRPRSRRASAGQTVIRRHVLPHLVPICSRVAALNGAAVVAVGTGLSYLGAGIQPPGPEWGNMLAEGQDSLTTRRTSCSCRSSAWCSRSSRSCSSPRPSHAVATSPAAVMARYLTIRVPSACSRSWA